MKQQIFNRYTKEVIFECEIPDGICKEWQFRLCLAEANSLRAKLSCADLSNKDLRGIQLFELNIEHADFKGSDLWGADFNSCQLNGSTFENADCGGANFHYADLANVIFTDANITGATGLDALEMAA
jgi:uncharacterized protein YjbI with pentapeptide repeats